MTDTLQQLQQINIKQQRLNQSHPGQKHFYNLLTQISFCGQHQLLNVTEKACSPLNMMETF